MENTKLRPNLRVGSIVEIIDTSKISSDDIEVGMKAKIKELWFLDNKQSHRYDLKVDINRNSIEDVYEHGCSLNLDEIKLIQY